MTVLQISNCTLHLSPRMSLNCLFLLNASPRLGGRCMSAAEQRQNRSAHFCLNHFQSSIQDPPRVGVAQVVEWSTSDWKIGGTIHMTCSLCLKCA